MTGDKIKAMAARIKKRRDELGYTQEKFAEVAELSVSSYSKIENAFQKPSLDSVIRIAEKLDVSIDYLVFGAEQPQRTDDTDVMRAILDSADADKLGHVKDLLARLINLKAR